MAINYHIYLQRQAQWEEKNTLIEREKLTKQRNVTQRWMFIRLHHACSILVERNVKL